MFGKKIPTLTEPVAEPDFRAIKETIDDPFNSKDVDIVLNDSTCPFNFIVDQLREPGMDYLFERNSAETLAKATSKKWVIVDSSRLQHSQDYVDKEKGFYQKGITTGDTILLERDSRYGEMERKHYEKLAIDRVAQSLSPMKEHDVNDITRPFTR